MFLKSVLALAAASALSIAGSTAAGARTQIRIVGSSTVYPFTTAVAEQFKRIYPQFAGPVVESTGTGGGIKLFCSGIGERFPDAANASRRIKASEIKDCVAHGVTAIGEIQIGLDGVALAQGRRAVAIDLTERDVYAALAATPFGRPNRARMWRDVNPTLPNTRIEVFGPPPTSGTRDAFAELILTPGCESDPAMKALKKSDDTRYKNICTRVREDGPYVEAGENDNLLVQKLASNPNALGVFGYSYLEENRDKIRGVPLQGVAATYDNIASFAYPASRPLYVYVKLQHVRAIRGLREFMAELTRETTWGRRGYLARRGLVASPDPVRAATARAAATLAPLDLASVK